jgi:hypothetical protein
VTEGTFCLSTFAFNLSFLDFELKIFVNAIKQ